MNEKIRKLKAALLALIKETQPLAEKSKAGMLSDDESTRFDELVDQIQKAQEELATEEKRFQAASSVDEAFRAFAEPADRTPHSLTNDGPDRRSLGQRFAESDAVKGFVGGRSAPFEVGSFSARHQLQHHEGMGPEELRTLVQTGMLPSGFIAPQVVPGIFRPDDLQGSLRDVLLGGTTTSDAIEFFIESSFTNNATGVPQATHTLGSSETPSNASVKPESALAFSKASTTVKTIAHWIPITRQMLQDAAQIQTYVEGRLLDGLRLEESDQLLNGGGTNDLTGLLNTSNVQDLDNTYFAGDPVQNDGTQNENFDRILRARTTIRTVGRARANFVVLNPTDLEIFLSSTDGQRQYFGAGPFSGTGITQLWGLRVVEDENIAAGTSLVGDGRMACVWDRMQSQIFIDTINDQFIRNMLTILAEERLALTVFRPQAFAVVELASV